MSLSCSLDTRPFQALINCLNGRLFGDKASEYTNDFVADQLYGGLGLERSEIDAEISSIEQLLIRMSEENWDVSKLERILKKTQMAADSQRALINFWNNEKEKIHEFVVKKSKWNSSLTSLSWRVDMKTASKNVPEINEPTAIFEFGSETGTKGSIGKTQQQAIRFEMNRSQIDEMIATLDNIQKKIDEFSY